MANRGSILPGQFTIMTKTTLSAALGLLVLLTGCATYHPAARLPGYHLVWADEFNGTALDTNKWIYSELGRRREALNVVEAVKVTNGCLTITTYTEGGRHYTGMISTERTFTPVHGYWEARIRFADAPGMWSAFWLESPKIGRPVGDTRQAGTEVDICEHRFTDNAGTNLAPVVQHTLHWDGYGKHHKSRGQLSPALHLDQGFHIYGCAVTAQGYQYYVDGQPTWKLTEAPTDAREFVILSSEIANHAWSGLIPPGGYGDRAHSTTQMTVDYVRYYAQAAAPVSH